jgi:phage repressor protein C with HTH and peptisase S24 domain
MVTTDAKRLAQVRRDNLKQWMESNGVSPTELAERLEVGKAYASLLFNEGRSFGEKAARSIEEKLGIPMCSLDGASAPTLTTSAWERPHDIPAGIYGLVEQTRISPSAVAGKVDAAACPLPPLAFKGDWLVRAGVKSRSLLLMGEQSGDSMEPYLAAGDLYMVDAAQTDIEEGCVYVLVYAGALRLRRLSRRFDGGLILRADNSRYPEEQLSAEYSSHIRVFGKVLWRAG